MKKCLFACVVNILYWQAALAQTDSALVQADTTTHKIDGVTIRAYAEDRALLQTPAAVNVIDKLSLSQYNNTSILPVVNATPGVRMEERSPGSYRFGIRGSSLESPFGVRNVKAYYNDIPYTDPGGNTYLNQIGFCNIQSIEIIKGPGSSLYGAGTGGVLLINSIIPYYNGISVNYTTGSYGLSNESAEIAIGDSAFHNAIRFQHINSDGYRQQSKIDKDVASWDAVMKHNDKSESSVHFLYGSIYYQTPGGLTINEYTTDQTMSRPRTASSPGAIDSKAAIYQKTFLAGFTYMQHFGKQWSNRTTLYGDYSQQYNPNLRNYSRTSEPNFGGRTTFDFKANAGDGIVQWITGAEAQQGLAQNRTYNNITGNPQNLQSDQGINTRQIFGFTQLSWQVHKWLITGGASINQLNIDLNEPSAVAYTSQSRTFNNQIAPRAAVLYALAGSISLYATAAKGFSPPTIAELAPTGSQVNFSLNPEQGWNYEIGTRGYILHQHLFFDVSTFYFSLHDAIVQRRDSLGGDYYLNAGSTTQNGIEAYLDYKLLKNAASTIRTWDIYASYTGYRFIYNKFMQLQNDYSGKQLPGVAPGTLTAGVALQSRYGVYINANFFYSSKITLNDANTAYSNAYTLLGGKLGWRREVRRYSLDIYAGIDNALNQKYSLGNDINAVNARYYNAAPGINYFAGLSVGISGGRKANG